MRVLGIDYGQKRIGLALSDPSGTISRPFRTIEFSSLNSLVEELQHVLDDEDVGLIVVGLPLSLRGGIGPKAEEVLRFVDSLRRALRIPIETWDERLSTVRAERTLREAEVPRRIRKGKVDALAAQMFLQVYLNSKRIES